MSHPVSQDPERGIDPNVDRDRSHSTPKPPPLESNFGDSSEPLFSMYTKVAEEEDKKMVERWQKDADGILIFTGLFSASVATLLSVTVPDLRPNSQDTSAFYLGNIYEVLADPNATRAPIPSPVAKPPPFSAPRYAVWVNSLWFLSLVMSVSCALWATSLNQWARRYIRLTQPARCRPEKRARMRAFYAKGAEKMHIPWAVEGLPTLLHLSLFLFFGGLTIYLFNVDREVFTCVVSWIGLFLMAYGLITLLPIIRHDSPYNTPLTTPLWFLLVHILYATIIVFIFTLAILLVVSTLIFLCFCCLYLCFDARKAWSKLLSIRKFPAWAAWQWRNFNAYSWVLRGVMKKAEKTVEKRSSEFDGRILGWTISALGDDDSLEKFFEVMPGFFDSELVKDIRNHLPCDLLRNALGGFLGRTLSSKSVTNPVKLRRLDIFMNTINLIGEEVLASSILETILSKHWVLVPQTIEVADSLARRCTSDDQITALYARCTVARVLTMVQERDDRWVELAARISGLQERDLRDDITHGSDNLLLAILMDLCRQVDHSHEWKLVKAFARLKFDVRDTLPELQHDFCTLWNELVDKARIRRDPHGTPIRILDSILPLYNTLHRGTVAAFSLDDIFDIVMLHPSSYALCSIDGHHYRPESIGHARVVNSRDFPLLNQPDDSPHSSPRRSTPGRITVSRQFKQEDIITRRTRSLSEPKTPREITESSQKAPTATTATTPTLSAHPSPYFTHASLTSAAAALRDLSLPATLSHPPKGTAHQNIVALFGEPDVGEILSTVSTVTLAPLRTQVPVPGPESPASPVGGAASPSNLLPQPTLSDVDFAITASPPYHDQLFSNEESLALLSSTTPSRPAGSSTLPRLRVRGLVNTGRMGFANAVLQLLVHSPPFWNLFRELGDSNGQRRAGDPETGGGTTPLVDATVRFFEEFALKEKDTPPTKQPLQWVTTRNSREDEEEKKENKVVGSFEPTYMYDAMKGKRQLKRLLDGKTPDAEEFFRLYLDTLDEELVELYTCINMHKLAPTTNVEEVEEGAQSAEGQTEVGERDNPASSAESPVSRIFGGWSRSTIHAPNQPDTNTIEGWRLLRLNIQPDSVHTIEDALAHISQLQPVQVCQSSLSEASQQVQIEALPPVLVIHLERFLYDVAPDGIKKITKPVQFAPVLEIPLEIIAPIPGKSAEPAHYKLYGVLYHHGNSAGDGHYTVDMLHPNGESSGGGAWLHIDDEAVSAVKHEDVFGGHDSERVDGRCVYMLSYCRTAPT